MRKLAALFVALPSLALASGYSLPNTNPRDLALSASAVAAQGDAAAAFALPASLSRVEGWSTRLSAGGVMIMTDWTDPTGVGGPAGAARTASIKKQLTPIGNVYVGYGGKLSAIGDRAWGVGFGIQPFGGSVVEWPSDWAGRYRIVKVNRQVFSGVLTAGVEVVPRVRLGGGLVYYYTMEELTQNAFMAPFGTGSSPTSPGTWDTNQADAIGKIDANGGALSYDVSAEVQPLPDLPLTFAIDYKHKATQTLEGDVKWQGLTPTALAVLNSGLSADALVFATQDAKQQLTIPNTLNIGAAYRVTKPLLVTATYTFDRWIVYDKDVFEGANGASIPVPRNYSNGWTLRAGAEYDVAPAVTVRGGVQYDHSGLDPKYYSPTLPDATSWAGSLGATYRFSRGLALDAAVFYAWMNQVTAQDPDPTDPVTGLEPQRTLPAGPFVAKPNGTFRGIYDTNALVFGLSLGWTPGAK